MRREKSPLGQNIRRRLDIQEALSRYPNLPPDEIQNLVRWFTKEATATEVAVVARHFDDQDAYTNFRRTHIDRLSALEMAGAVFAFMLLIVALAVSAAVL